MRNNGTQIMLSSLPSELLNLLVIKFTELPSSRVASEHLEGVASEFTRVVWSIVKCSGN